MPAISEAIHEIPALSLSVMGAKLWLLFHIWVFHDTLVNLGGHAGVSGHV
jgi:hypothetical protein